MVGLHIKQFESGIASSSFLLQFRNRKFVSLKKRSVQSTESCYITPSVLTTYSELSMFINNIAPTFSRLSKKFFLEFSRVDDCYGKSNSMEIN